MKVIGRVKSPLDSIALEKDVEIVGRIVRPQLVSIEKGRIVERAKRNVYI